MIGDMIKVRTDKIEELRRRKGLTQEELAKSAGVSLSTYTKIKRGEVQNVKLDTISHICNVLRCKYTTILQHDLDPIE